MKSSVEIWSGLLFLRAALLLSALSAPPVAGQESRILYSLAGYWPLDGNLSDARNVNHGAAVEGEIAYVSRGIDSGFGGAVELSGNEFIEIASVNLGIELSVSLWCEIDDQSPDQVLVSIGSASPWTIGVTAGGGIVFNVGEERLESDVLEKGVHHIVVTTEVYNRVSRASRLSLFVDSNFEAVADVPNLYFPGGRLRIGASDDAGGRHWNGMVDEVAVWRRVISEQEVRILWADGKGRVLGMEMPDADGDRIPDYWEIAHGLDPNADDREQDSDDDGLSNIDEFRFGTNPESVDSDRDGLPDGSESGTGKWSGENDTGTSPLALDSDRDGLADSLENPDRPSLTRPPTDPNQYDSDSDGVPDFYEVLPSYDPPFRVDGIHASDQRRLQISLPSRADTYYVLFRSNSPQFDGGGTAVSGALGNNDLLEFYPGRRAEGVYFYRVAKFTPPVDLDSDGVDDFMEAYSGSALAPLNPATKIRYLDGVVRIPDLATLEAMSSIVPPGPEVPDARQHVVKFVVTDLPDQPRELYFLNTKTHSNHQLFVKATGLKCLEIYQCINAEFSYFPNLQTGAGENGLYAIKFDGGLSSDDAMEVFDLVAANLPVAKGNIAVRDKNLRPNNISDLRAAGIQVLTDDEIGADEITYLGLNEGEAFGRLRVIEQGQRPSLRDIAIYKTIPNDVPHIAGTITEQEQTPLSHVNLRAIQNRAPNAYIRDASTSERIAPLIGQYVYFRVNNTGYEIRKADQAEVDAFFVGIRPLASQVPPRDLTFTEIAPLAEIGFDSAKGFGVKSANLAEMRKISGMSTVVPDGFAIPFYFYDAFMKHNGFYAMAAEMMAEPSFIESVDVRDAELDAFRKAIRKGDMPQWMLDALAEVQSQFSGDSIRCRSSTNNEDLPNFNGAGLYDSYTHHQPEEGHLSKSIRQVYASLWNLRAFEERDFYRIDHFAAAMGVLLHRNFEDEDANGVVVSKNILFGADDEPSSGIYYVNAQFGENLVTNPEGNAIPEQSLISTSNEPIYLSYSNLEGGRERVLSSAQSKDLANKLEQIHEHFKLLYGGDENFAIEIEFKITAEHELAIKQARPWLN